MASEPIIDEHLTGDATTILWGDVTYTNPVLMAFAGIQGGNIDTGNDMESTTAWGAKIGGKSVCLLDGCILKC